VTQLDSPANASLPHGFSSDGSWARTATLRELNGYDELEFAEMDGLGSPAARTTALLSRVAGFGEAGGSKDGREIVRDLTVGDRVALMLQLRRLTLGDRIECTIACPACAEDMSLSLSAGNLLQPRSREARTEGEVRAGGLTLKVRPATGADVEALESATGESSLAEALVRSCIVSSDGPLPPHIPDDVVSAVSERLEEMDPQAETLLDMSCPTCGHRFKTPFLIEDFFAREIRARAPQVEKEVHWIAFNYHWSEADILSLPMRKRARYVDLINKTLAGETI
jgi:hypothetical protein